MATQGPIRIPTREEMKGTKFLAEQEEGERLAKFQRRMTAYESLQIMREVFIKIVREDQPEEIEAYLTAHDRACEILSGLTGERMD